MTATNHAVMGSLIVAAVANPVIGLPLALLSHFVLDSLPHFGAHTVANPRSKEFRAIITTDAFLTISFMIVITFAGIRAGYEWWLLPLGGLLGWAPDLMWYKHYQSDLNGHTKEWDPVRTFHKRIQRWEVSWGWTVECAWFIIMVGLLSRILFP